MDVNVIKRKQNYMISYNQDMNIIPQKMFDWCKNIRCLPFDFCIEDLKLIIELDDRQHFE